MEKSKIFKVKWDAEDEYVEGEPSLHGAAIPDGLIWAIKSAVGKKYYTVEEIPDQQAKIDRLREALRKRAVSWTHWGKIVCGECQGEWPTKEGAEEEHKVIHEEDGDEYPCPCELPK